MDLKRFLKRVFKACLPHGVIVLWRTLKSSFVPQFIKCGSKNLWSKSPKKTANKTKSIGVITVCRARNYGACLQAFAMNYTLQKNGYTPYFINYNPRHRPEKNALKDAIRLIRQNRFKESIFYFLSSFVFKTKPRKIINKNRFQKFDMIVIGSDQIWDLTFLGITNYTYRHPEWWGNNLPAPSFSYAPSINCSNADTLRGFDFVKPGLEKLRSISVRDTHSAEVLRQFTDKEIKIVCDPTFLLTYGEWRSLEGKCCFENFILVYSYGNITQSNIDYICRFARTRNKKLVSVLAYLPWCDVNIPVSLASFLRFVSKADYIITSTLHGTAFSLIYQKRFICYPLQAKVYELLKQFDLSNRDASNLSYEEFMHLLDTPLNHAALHEKKSLLREEGLNFLLTNVDEQYKPPILRCDSVSESECIGCGACVQICPINAIKMRENYEGFLHPYIQKNTNCTKCGKCASACPVLTHGRVKLNTSETIPDECIVGFSLNHEIQRASSSGGFFSEIALIFFEYYGENAAIFGAAYDTPFSVKHRRIDSPEELDLFRRSKYVQSDIGDVYTQVCEHLSLGKSALFSGTPCQCAGLLAYCEECGVPLDKLLVVDFICNSVPSPRAYRAYLSHLEKQRGAKVTSVNFRAKQQGVWQNMLIYFSDGGEPYFSDYESDEFTHDWLWERVSIRECCSSCVFQGITHAAHNFSDITLGDAWGIKMRTPLSEVPEITDGLSLLFANTDRHDIIPKLKQRCFWEQHSIKECSHARLRMTIRPRSNNAEEFFKRLYQNNASLPKRY